MNIHHEQEGAIATIALDRPNRLDEMEAFRKASAGFLAGDLVHWKIMLTAGDWRLAARKI